MVRPSSRGGVPVLSRPCPRPISRIWPARAIDACSPRRPRRRRPPPAKTERPRPQVPPPPPPERGGTPIFAAFLGGEGAAPRRAPRGGRGPRRLPPGGGGPQPQNRQPGGGLGGPAFP